MPSYTPQQQMALLRMLRQRMAQRPQANPVGAFARNQVSGAARNFASNLARQQAGRIGSELLPEGLRGVGANISSAFGQIAPYLPFLQAARARDPGQAALQLVGRTAVNAANSAAASAAAAGAGAGAAGGIPSFMGFDPVTAIYAISQLADAYDARKEGQRITRDLGRWSQDQEATGGEYAMPWIHLQRLANPGNSELMRQFEAMMAGYSPEEMGAVAGRDTVEQMRQRTSMDENPWNGTQWDLDQGMQARFREKLLLELYNQYLNAFRAGKTDMFGNPVEGSGFSYARPQAARFTGSDPFGTGQVNPYTGSPMYSSAPDVRGAGFLNPTYADPSSPLGGGADNQYYSYRRGTQAMAPDQAEMERRARDAANRAAFGNFPVTPPQSSTQPAQQAAPSPGVVPAPAYGRSPEFSMESTESQPWYLGGQGA